MARGITQSDVWKACDALLLEGARPTIERVRQKLGTGSPNTVSPSLDTWFKHLGGRIKDPGAFAAPPALPDPVQQAAQHFWETALAQTRLDFDERLRDGLALAVTNVEAEKEKAAQAVAAAVEAAARAKGLHDELSEQAHLIEQLQQELAAERGRLEEIRAAMVAANVRMRELDTRSTAELTESKRQLAAAVERADGADRRVALELERERGARAKAERHAESLQRTLDTGRDREKALEAQLSATAAALGLERLRLTELRSANDACVADALTARNQVTGLQASLDRLATLVETGTRRVTPAARKRSVKPPASGTST